MPIFNQALDLLATLGFTRLMVLNQIGLVSTWNSRIFAWQAIVPRMIKSSIPQLSRSLTIDLIKDLNRRMRREFAQFLTCTKWLHTFGQFLWAWTSASLSIVRFSGRHCLISTKMIAARSDSKWILHAFGETEFGRSRFEMIQLKKDNFHFVVVTSWRSLF